MKKSLLFLIFAVPLFIYAQPQVGLDYYLPADVFYNPQIPKPADVIGHEVGEWHVTHDKLIAYITRLAELSPRMTIETRGYTYEGRPSVVLTISSPENLANIETIRQQHLKLSQSGSESLDVSDMPIVVYQGYSIHGNEPSGSNASMVVAYYLAAAEGPQVDELLKNTVILLDPAFNPDGLQRFAQWANVHKSHVLNPDPNDREYHEVWPGGRSNHYWFDLNRDWLPAQLPESQARLKTYHAWKPNILTDHHEMGTNSTFFFQPGEPKRVHPLTPVKAQELTAKIGQYHVAALDSIGSFYFSEEDYDDYYYGKGSTFPDVNGAVGILFEQASSRGHIQDSENGLLTFPFTIRNQVVTAFSTLKAATHMREEMLNYQRDFFNKVRTDAAKLKNRTYVFGAEKDAATTYHLAEMLKRHQIHFYETESDFTAEGKHFKQGYSYLVPRNQDNSLLIDAIFEKRTTFQDSLFYDISGWTYLLTFGLDYAEIASPKLGKEVTTLQLPEGQLTGSSAYAYLMEWHEYYTPKVLYQMLDKGLRVKVGRTPFTINGVAYDYGTIMIPVQNQNLSSGELQTFLSKVAADSHLTIQAVTTGYSTSGIDLGSGDFRPLEKPKIAVLMGGGINAHDAGEIWHVMDQRYEIPVTKLDLNDFDRVDLSEYSTILLTDGRGKVLTGDQMEKLKTWVRNGGTLIGFRNAINLLKENKLLEVELRKSDRVAQNITFGQKEDYFGAQETSGALFDAVIDRSHPINFGYTHDHVTLFRNTNIFMEPDKQSFNNPILYTQSPLLSGYISEENEALLKGSSAFKVSGLGKGKVVVFTDNPNFRAFCYGTNKLMMNAIFFSRWM